MPCQSQVVEAKIPQAVLGVEGEDARINSKCVVSRARAVVCEGCVPCTLRRTCAHALIGVWPATAELTLTPSSLLTLPPLPFPLCAIRMIKDDRVAHEDKRGAFARNQDVSDKVDLPLNIGKNGRSLALDDPDDDWTM